MISNSKFVIDLSGYRLLLVSNINFVKQRTNTYFLISLFINVVGVAEIIELLGFLFNQSLNSTLLLLIMLYIINHILIVQVESIDYLKNINKQQTEYKNIKCLQVIHLFSLLVCFNPATKPVAIFVWILLKMIRDA